MINTDFLLYFHYYLEIPLSAVSIMQVGEYLGYKKVYISKYPEVFERNIRSILITRYNDNKLYIQRLVNDKDIKTLNKQTIHPFMNITLKKIVCNYYKISKITEFKNTITEIIALAHEITKKEISDSRRNNK
jgi:hypothetical protein